MRVFFILLFSIIFSSCFFLINREYSIREVVGAKDKSGKNSVYIYGKYLSSEEKIVKTNVIKGYIDLNKKFVVYCLGDSISNLNNCGVPFQKLRLKYQDSIFTAYRFSVPIEENYFDVLEKDGIIYRVFSNTATVGDISKEYELEEVK